MQQELKNIFVTKEVAKLAKEKGFNEICAAYYKQYGCSDFEDCMPNTFRDYFELETCDNPEKFIEAPTHFQLIQWLISNHKIHVSQQATEIWMIAYDLPCGRFGKNYKNNINDALILALNQINQQDGK